MSLQEIKSIKQQADIVKIISHFIELKRDGANFTAKCPFHNERSKSFAVSQSKGIYKCFGCGASGDVLDFVMKHKGVSYKEAISWISENQNITPDKEYITETLPEPEISYLPKQILDRSISDNHSNNFTEFLSSIFPSQKISYHIGSSKHWPGSVIFWYVDVENKVRSGKIMHYDPTTGKRTKEPKPLITWVHKVLKIPDFNMSICLFGEYLLPLFPCKKIGVVESEKTAIIASLKYPNALWLASGSLSNLSYKRCLCLINRDITLYPDVGAEDRWREKMEQLSELIPGKWSIKPMNSEIKGYDLCDYILDNLKKCNQETTS